MNAQCSLSVAQILESDNVCVYAVELSFLTILTLYDRAQDKYRPFFQSPFQDSNLSVEDWKQAAGKKVVLYPYVN